MSKLDRKSLEAIELTAPGASTTEAQRLRLLMSTGEIFKAFNEDEKESIWKNLWSETTDRLVPSLFMFFENLKYIKGPADCMRRLIGTKRRTTIRSVLEDTFLQSEPPSGSCVIQMSRNQSASIEVSDRFDILYRQLWLYAFREYRDIPETVQQKLAGPSKYELNEVSLYRFASLAYDFGFRTDQVKEILERDPDRDMVRRFLTSVRKPDQYIYTDLDDCITRVVEIVQEARSFQDNSDNSILKT
jgi:hypothetical protein